MRNWRTALLAFLLALPVSGAFAQGCSLCRDATAGSAPQARKSLRLAIPILAIPAAGIFTVILYVSITNSTKSQEKQ